MRVHHLITRMSGLFLFVLLLAPGATALAQPFSSGSTGADGVFNDTTFPAGCARSQNVITCALPTGGVYNLTTFTLPVSVTLRFTKNARNTPVTILTTGDVTINGTIDISGVSATGIAGADGGPGGFRGGEGGIGIDLDVRAGKPGEGPGGGGGGKLDGWYGGGGGFAVTGINSAAASPERGGFGGPRYGTRALLPLIGGSGGGGQAASNSGPGGGGGGGAGAILIASSGSILFGSGSALNAIGGNGFVNAGGGSGGAVRLMANRVAGNPSLQIRGGFGGGSGQTAYGYVRVEATDYNNFFPSTSNPNYSITRTFNPITLANAPQLRIVSVGGVNAPVAPVGSFSAAPDIVVPTTTSNPVQVALQAGNVPVSSVIQVSLTTETGDRTTSPSTPLAGTLAASTATATVTLPTTGVSVLTATVSVDGLLAFGGKPVFIDGERIARVEISATYGATSRVTYITQSGRRIEGMQ